MHKQRSETKRTPVWFYVVLFLLPLIFFVILEFSLRMFGYGKDYEVFVHLAKSQPGKLFLNPEITGKYFTNLKQGPGTIADGFDEVKNINAFRVFVLGESSAAGWPYPPNGSFPRYIKRRLELMYPENIIEVINCGISAINTYTIRDILPEILNRKPDLILIYTGHNEYYGALGPGSAAYLGNSRWAVNTYIWLQQFKTMQLVQNIIKWGYSLFNGEQLRLDSGNETLMSRMIGESLIPINSETYKAGIDQFEGNMNDILGMITKNNVPVIIANLTANIRDLKPFVSVKSKEYPLASEVFSDAQSILSGGDSVKAKVTFKYAKELDALRFRAPGEINSKIKRLADNYKLYYIDIDSAFSVISPHGIVGYNLTVDHLHPTIEGYSLIGREFFRKMTEENLLPKGKRNNLSWKVQDSLMDANLPYTPLDSTISYMRLITLIGSYPFVPKDSPNMLMKNFKFDDFNDSLAHRVITQQVFWEVAHAEAAEKYFNAGNTNAFMKEMDAVIQERTYEPNSYQYTAKKLIDANHHQEALKYLYPLHKTEPSYFSSKWIGQIELNNKNYSSALHYLEQAIKYSEADWQTWYNMAGAYYFNGNSKLALSAVQMSLKLNSRNPLAINLYQQLARMVNKKG